MPVRNVVHIERLATRHQRARFDCGEPALNDFLQRQAGQLERCGIGKTYVAVAAGSDAVIGFVTLSAGQIESQKLPPHLKLPRYPEPTLRIGRLAVDLRQQGQGVGQDLMAFALRVALEFSRQVDLYAVQVDAKNEAAKAFYARLGFQATLDDALSLYLPVLILAKLAAPEPPIDLRYAT